MAVYSATTEGELALSAGTARTVVQLRQGGNRGKPRIVEWGVSFDGTSATAEPVRIRVLLYGTAAAGTSSAATVVPWDPDNPTADSTAQRAFTVEPTYSADTPHVLADHVVHPQTGIIRRYPTGPNLDFGTGLSRFGLEVTAPAAVNCVAYIVWEE